MHRRKFVQGILTATGLAATVPMELVDSLWRPTKSFSFPVVTPEWDKQQIAEYSDFITLSRQFHAAEAPQILKKPLVFPTRSASVDVDMFSFTAKDRDLAIDRLFERVFSQIATNIAKPLG